MNSLLTLQNPTHRKTKHCNLNVPHQDGGRMNWDYKFTSVPVYLYDDSTRTGRLFLEFLLVCWLCIDCVLEFREFLKALKSFRIMNYFRDYWNAIDITHFSLMWTGWTLWFRQVSLNDSLQLPPGFAILKSFSVENPARLFLTNPDREYAYLQSRRSVGELAENLDFFNVITSICVVLFILRILKAANFQPRIALVTRTVVNVISDLAHFVVLFVLILVGYAISGVALFGNQYDGFANLTNAIFYLLIVLMAFSPDSGWVQMNHAAPSWAFNLYLWTWMLIGSFVLLNIFLAILMNGYSALHESADGNAESIINEVWVVLMHEAHQLVKFFKKDHHFISDRELVARLSAQLGEPPFDETLRHYSHIAVAGRMEISSRLQPGKKISALNVLRVLHKYFPEHHSKFPSVTEEVCLHPSLRGIMARFGRQVVVTPAQEVWAEKADMFLRRVELENARRMTLAGLQGRGTREQAMEAAAAVLSKDRSPLAPVDVNAVRLLVVVEQMRGLPRMDVFRGADPYGIIFLEDAPGTFETEVRRGTSEKQWVWDPALSRGFEWQLVNHPMVLRPERKLVVMVYDKDQITSDDLIGCATVALGELAEGGVFDGWKDIMRPPKTSNLRLPWGPKARPELKLRVALEPIIPESDEAELGAALLVEATASACGEVAALGTTATARQYSTPPRTFRADSLLPLAAADLADSRSFNGAPVLPASHWLASPRLLLPQRDQNGLLVQDSLTVTGTLGFAGPL